jgi:hypothetical protein
MDEVKQLAGGQYGDEDDVIIAGLQNWAQELLDEGAEGGYFTAKIDGNILHITDIGGSEVAAPALTGQTYVEAFKKDARGTLLQIQNALRKLIDTHEIQL